MEFRLAVGRKRRSWIVLLAAAGITTYGAYKLYNLPAVVRRRQKLARLLTTLVFFAESVSSSSDLISLVADDLNAFLRSDSDEIPGSIRQMAKIAASNEFAISVSKFSEAVTAGVARGVGIESGGSDFSEKVLERVFSGSGKGFVSKIAGSFAKGLVMGLYSTNSDRDEELPRWVNLVCAEKSRRMIGECIEKFVGTAVAVYLEKTRDVNTYDCMFSGLTHPKHEAKMKDLLVSVCNGAVETLVRTSHDAVVRSKTSLGSEEDRFCGMGGEVGRDKSDEMGGRNGGWVDRVSSTLSVPRNRSFVLDLTGRVTFDTVRSFLEFMLGRFSDSVRSGASVFRQEVVGKGLEVVKYISAKTMLVLTICLSFCLHLVTGTKFLVPA